MFQMAKPVFPAGKSGEMNVFAAFRACFKSCPQAELHLTAASFYRVFVNGRFAGFGPARTAGGFAREDILPLSGLTEDESIELVIEVAGYHCRSLSTVRQPSFLMAEIRCGDWVLACTGRDFEGYLPSCKLQKTERYSGQRHFSEVWDFRNGSSRVRSEECAELEILPLPLTVLPRIAPYPVYRNISVPETASSGRLEPDESIPVRRDFYSFPITQYWGGFCREDIPFHPYEWIQQHRQVRQTGRQTLPITLSEAEYAILDLSRIETGFLTFSATVLREADVVIGFSEDASGDRFAFTDMHTHNVLEYLLPAGESAEVMSFEPYVLRYAIIAVRSGSIRIEAFGMKSYEHPAILSRVPATGNPALDVICESAVRTFAHNTLDIYMDCPSRERAGWLCDSYFTAQTEYALLGKTPTEQAFLENFRLYRSQGEYPDGVLPMCYPSDPQDSGKFIPQWTMWYILEVEQYLNLRNPEADREQFRQSIDGLLRFYRRYENADGLLEHLPSWNFVEWSVANEWTQDVSYPTNLLYAQTLESIYRIYGDEACLRRSEEIRRTVIAQAFNGEVFLDHAVRDENGKPVLQKDCSEACQYYAILFGGIDLNTPRYKRLRHLVTEVFGANRKQAMPEIAEVNAFIGAYLRLEALLKMGEYRLVLAETEAFFGQMGSETGTLWEYRQRHGSRDHGFASYALVAIRRALEGLESGRSGKKTAK